MKNSIDLLGIVLPALIVGLAIFRAFSKRSKGINGLIIFLGIVLILLGLIRYAVYPTGRSEQPKEPKPLPLNVSAHSTSFKGKLQHVLDRYYRLAAHLRVGEVSAVANASTDLLVAVDSLSLEELKQDSLIYQTALQPFQNIRSALQQSSPADMERYKQSFHTLSTELFSLLSIIRYDQVPIYWFECETGLGEDNAGNWLSANKESENPYQQSACAELKTTLNFVVDSTKKP